jgi:hypothetical protein
VIDGTWNFTDTVNRIFTIDDIVVVSVADMVKKASDAATKLGGKIENLLIAGHGSDGPDLLRAVSQALGRIYIQGEKENTTPSAAWNGRAHPALQSECMYDCQQRSLVGISRRRRDQLT